MATQATYIEYLLKTSHNYTCTHLAQHLPQVSHDHINRFLRRSSFHRPNYVSCCCRYSTTRPKPFCLSMIACRVLQD